MILVGSPVNAICYFLLYFVAILPLIRAMRTLHVGGLFPMSGSSVASAGKSLLPASELALNMVNRRVDVLPGYQLQLISNDTQVFNYILVINQAIITQDVTIISCSSATTKLKFHWIAIWNYPVLNPARFPEIIYNLSSAVKSILWPLMTFYSTMLTACAVRKLNISGLPYLQTPWK